MVNRFVVNAEFVKYCRVAVAEHMRMGASISRGLYITVFPAKQTGCNEFANGERIIGFMLSVRIYRDNHDILRVVVSDMRKSGLLREI